MASSAFQPPGSALNRAEIVGHDGLVPGTKFTGIDYSEAMVAGAKAFNGNLIETGDAEFRLASVEAIPFADGSFDQALTINTIYFWHRSALSLKSAASCVPVETSSSWQGPLNKWPKTQLRVDFAFMAKPNCESCYQARVSGRWKSSCIVTKHLHWTEVKRPNEKVFSLSAGRKTVVSLIAP